MGSSVGERILERNGSTLATRLLGCLAMFVCLAAAWRLLRLTDTYARSVLYWDNWGYYWKTWDARFSWWDLWMQQLGPHRSGIGLVVSRLFLPIFRADMRTEAFLAVGLILAAGLLGVGLKRKCSGRLEWTDALIFIPFASPHLWQVFVETVNTSHGAFPLLIVILGAWALLIRRDSVRYGVALVLIWFAVFTGFAFFWGAIMIAMLVREMVLAARRGKWRTVAMAGGAVVSAELILVLFFHDYELKTGLGPLHLVEDWTRYPLFVALAYAKMGGVDGGGWWVIAAGTVLAVASTAACAVSFPEGTAPERLAPACLVLFSLVFACAMAFGRAELDPVAAQSSRYLPLMLPGLAGLYIMATQWRRRWLRQVTVVAVGMMALLLTICNEADQAAMLRLSDGKTRWAESYLQSRNVDAANRTSSFRVSPATVAHRMQRKLDEMATKRLGIFAQSLTTEGPR